MNFSRRRALALLGAAALAPSCTHGSGETIKVGSKNFTEELLLGELYAQLLEKGGLRVERKLNLGGTQIAMASLQRGEIDLYPEYTGTALLDVLKRPPLADPSAVYATVKSAYEKKYGLTWLAASPMNDSQALATTRKNAQKYHMSTLSDLSRMAPQLRLAAIPEFLKRPDALPGLQKVYGGFRFKDVRLFDIGLKYKALLTGDVDVAVAFGTDGELQADDLVTFVDDKHFWPAYHVAPVIRQDALAKHPSIAGALDAFAPKLTDAVMRRLNFEIAGPKKREPADVAAEFLRASGSV